MAQRVIVTTDHKWKEFKYREDVPKRVLASEFDYQDPKETLDGYFKYKGGWLHLDQFTRIPRSADGLSGWDGIVHWSFSNGVVIKLSPDGEQYQVGYYYLKG